MSGLGAQGFVRARMPDLLSALETAQAESLGPDLDTQSSVLSRLNGISAERLAEIWELLEILSWSRSPDGATDARLDEVASLAAVSRGRPSQVDVLLRGTPGTVIPAGTEISAPGSSVRWSLTTPVTLVATPVPSWKLKVTAALASTYYALDLNGAPHGFTTAGLAPSTANLAAALVLVVNAAGLPLIARPPAGAAFSIDMAWPNLSATVTVHPTVSGAVALTQGQAILGFGTGVFRATTPGPVPAPAGALTAIQTAVPGLEAVLNPMAAELGSDDEPDAAFRLRWLNSVSAPESASLDAIRAAILAVDGVTAVWLTENPSPTPTGLLPPHSLELIVEGGQDQDIAEALWRVRPAGIPLVHVRGQRVGVSVLDAAGGAHELVFNRPAEIQAWLHVRYEAHPEEDLPDAVEDLLKDAVLRQGAALRTGEDLQISRLLAAAYLVPGVYRLSIKVNDGQGPAWHDSYLKAGPAEIIRVDATRVYVQPL